jgi:hypothetical protein
MGYPIVAILLSYLLLILLGCWTILTRPNGIEKEQNKKVAQDNFYC